MAKDFTFQVLNAAQFLLRIKRISATNTQV
jgi:hypothetical protein